MGRIKLAQFSGEIPRLISRLLPETGAQVAENVRLDDGGLTPIRKSQQETSFPGITDIQTIYKFGTDWLYWLTKVNAVPGPVATDRLYYTGDGTPKMRVGSTIYELALPGHGTQLGNSLSGVGSGDVTTRLYVFTWVTDFGEESPPNPVTAEISWQTGITVTLTGFPSTPAGRNITKQRIYRSQSSSQNGTDLFLIEERAATNANYVDTHTPTDFGEVIPSKDYDTPPTDLAGLIPLPNGMMAAFSGKQICFCEPYQPHAWPEKYRLTTSYPIVALAAFANTLVAGTTGVPYITTGNSPDSMVQEKTELNLPCLNAGGMVDLGYSVAYPSGDGLVVVSANGTTVVTEALFTRNKWQKLSPDTFIAAQFGGRYFLNFEYLEIDGSLTHGTRILDLSGQQPFVLRASINPSAWFYELTTSKLFYLVDDTVYEWDAIGQTNEVMTWTSKRFVLEGPVSLGAILVESGQLLSPEEQAATDALLAAIEAANAALFAGDLNAEIDGAAFDEYAFNGDAMTPLPGEKYISVRVYADGELIRTVTDLDQVKRIPARKAKEWEIQVNGTAEVEQITLATTAYELNEI